MRSALAALVALTACCATPGTYRAVATQHVVATALSTSEAVTVIHPPHVGQLVELRVRGLRAPFAVVEVLGAGGAVRLRRLEPGPDLEPGDSGAPLFLLQGREQ